MNFQFQYKNLVLLLAAIPLFILLFVLLLAWKRKVRKRIGDQRLVKVLTSNFSSPLFTTKFFLLSLGFAIGVVAVMNPRKPGAADNVTRKGIDVVVAMDVSKSMLATDLAPSRLERAKQFINKLMAAMPDDRIGLVLFAGKAYLQMPLTADHGAARLFVSSASPESVPQQGTVISDALNMSVRAFNPKERRFKGRSGYSASNAHVKCADPDDGKPEATDPGYYAGTCIQKRSNISAGSLLFSSGGRAVRRP